MPQRRNFNCKNKVLDISLRHVTA